MKKVPPSLKPRPPGVALQVRRDGTFRDAFAALPFASADSGRDSKEYTYYMIYGRSSMLAKKIILG
jgi:hypothetical protein